jgi:hypothetical protein
MSYHKRQHNKPAAAEGNAGNDRPNVSLSHLSSEKNPAALAGRRRCMFSLAQLMRDTDARQSGDIPEHWLSLAVSRYRLSRDLFLRG